MREIRKGTGRQISLPRQGSAMEAFTGQNVEKRLSAAAAAFYHVTVEESIPSTNAALKEAARAGAPAGTVLIAKHQTAGTGRLGRTFFSPAASGLYMSLLLRPALSGRELRLLTPAAAVAAAESIEETVPGTDARIKWVNDIYVNEKKVCGILTEAAFTETGSGGSAVLWAVIGIGIDIFPPEGGFPEELSRIAGTLLPEAGADDLRPRLAASLLERLYIHTKALPGCGFVAGYKRRSLLDGRRVLLHRGNAEEARPATVLGITDDCGLRVRCPDGTTEVLYSGEADESPLSVRQADRL